MVEESYLRELISKISALRKKVKYKSINTSDCVVAYIPTKKKSFVGMKQGYAEQLSGIENSIKESAKIRANCKDYLKLFKNREGKVLQIEKYAGGRIDCIFQAYYDENLCCLFPFSANGGFYPTYSYVTVYENGKIIEEYMVDGSQIVYERYLNESETCVGYEYVNYVSGGKSPILEARAGVFRFNPLRYENKNLFL